MSSFSYHVPNTDPAATREELAEIERQVERYGRCRCGSTMEPVDGNTDPMMAVCESCKASYDACRCRSLW